MTLSGSPDALSGLAPLLRVRPELESLCRFGAQWALPHEISTGGWAPFHLVAQGRCVIEVAGTAPIPLETGDTKPRNLKVSGLERPRLLQFCAAKRPNSIRRVFSG